MVHAADTGRSGIPDGEERHWAEARFPPEDGAGGSAPAGMLPEFGALACAGDVDEEQAAWNERAEAGGVRGDYPLNGCQRAGEARGSGVDAESSDGGEAGCGRGAVAGAPRAGAAERFAGGGKSSGENGALILVNPSKWAETVR